MRRSVSKLKQRRSIRRLRWRDRVRENSVVRKFGPKNNTRIEHHLNVLVLDSIKRRRRASEPPGVADEARAQDGAAFPTLVVFAEPDAHVEVGRLEVRAAAEVQMGGSGASEEEKALVKSKYVVPPLVQVVGSGECHGAGYAGPKGDEVGADAGGEEEPVSSVSYLSVPDTPSSRRPSTADLVIEKLQVERVDGGGLSIQGVALASNCHVTLCVFGIFFLLAGIILSYVSYSINMKEDDPKPLETETSKKNQSDHESSVVQMRIIGPSFLALGLLMLILGCSFYGLARKINRDEKERRRKISEQQVSQLENSFSHAHSTSSPLHTATAPAVHQQYPILAVRRTSWWMDPTPIENPAPDTDPTPERRDSTGRSPSPNGSLPSLMSPLPPELKSPPADIQGDIACFPPSANPAPPTRPSSATTRRQSATDRTHSGGTSSRPTSVLPPSSAGQGRPNVEFMPSDLVYYQNAGYTVPFIQVTAPPPTGPVLPRLSRHAANRMDSRPTTADSR